MATERKPLYISIPSVHQFELPTTASAGGVDLNTGRNLYYNTSSLAWVPQETFSGSNAIFGDITGSISGTLGGNPFIVAGPNITANYNSLGQWSITGSLSNVSYGMQGSNVDYTVDSNYAPANLTASNGGSVTDQLGDGTIVPYFYGIHKNYISTLSRSIDGLTVTHTNTNSLTAGQQLWPFVDAGPTLIIPLEDYKDIQVDINISFNLASFAVATGGDWNEATISLCAEDYFDRLPYRVASISLIGYTFVSSGNVSELSVAWAKENTYGENFIVGYTGNFLDVSTGGEGTSSGITTRHYRIVVKGPIAKIYTGPDSSTLTYRGGKFNSKVRTVRDNMVLSIGIGQNRSTPLSGYFLRVNSLSLTKL